MSVFREVKITWDNKEYSFVPSLALIRKIERGDSEGSVSVVHLIHQASAGKPQLSFMAWLVALVMNHAGAEVDEEELYAQMYSFDKEAFTLYQQVIEAISPTPSAKKPQGSEEPQSEPEVKSEG
jgi:hypothetical protein